MLSSHVRRYFNFFRFHWLKLAIFSCVFVMFMAGGLARWAGAQIASPPRKAMLEYHREFLSNPIGHGLSIQYFTASDGTPCLVSTPLESGHLGERGSKIRDQLALRGIALKPPGAVNGTVVLLHGRKGRKDDLLPIAERLGAAGFRCVIPDLPAHGDHPNPLATYGVMEAGLPAMVLEEASAKFEFQTGPVALLGISMGGSVATHAASLQNAPWKAMVIISSFDRLSSAVRCQAGHYLGETIGHRWAEAADPFYQRKSGCSIRDIQPSVRASKIKIPVLVAHGTCDQVSPITCGKHLFDSFNNASEKKWLEIKGADHYTALVTAQPVYADIAEWMITHLNPA